MRGRLLVAVWSVAFAAFASTLVAQQKQAKGGTADDPGVPQEQREATTESQANDRLRGIPGWLRAFASPDKKEGLSVNAGIIVAGSSLSGGVGYRRLNLFKNVDYEVEGNLSVRGYQDYRAAIGFLDARQSTLEFDVADRKVASLFNTTARKSPGSALYLDLRYRDYPRHTYYGTGIDSLEENRADYALHGLSVEGVWQWQLTSTLGVSARGGWLDLAVGPGHNDALINVEDRFAPALTPGEPEQPLYFTYGIGVVHDTRAEPGLPENGHMFGVAVRRYSASDTPTTFAPGASVPTDLSFTRVTFDARGYRRLLSHRGVLAVRGLVSSDFTGENGATPFYLQQSLGGGETLRGFHSYRFPDQSLAHASVEYRWRAHRYVEIAPFLDTGTVASSLSDLSLSSFKMSPGVGIRGRTSRRTIGRLDWAWSSEGQRISIGLGPAF
jgi:outer membrane protein assembly factor BamA